MDIHKPKPWHGVREFLKEYLIIVVGVLTALGAEAVVENIHERRLAAEAREAVRAEVRENLWWLDQRATYEPCIKQTLAQLTTILGQVRRGQKAPVVNNLNGLSFFAKVTAQRWNANAEAGRASLFPGDEQRILGNIYYTTEMYRQWQDQEQTAWAKLGFVQGLETWSPSDVHELSVLLAEAKGLDPLQQLAVERSHQWARRLALTASNPNSVEGKLSGVSDCQLVEKRPPG